MVHRPPARRLGLPRTAWPLLAAAVILTLGLAGCASSSKTTQSSDRTGSASSEADKRKPEAPTPEQLAESPCGNPNWAQLPDQHTEDGDPANAQQPTDAEKDRDSEKPKETESAPESSP